VAPSTSRPGALRWLAGKPFSFTRARARLSSISRIANHNNMIAASSLETTPFLMTLRSWKFNDSIAFVV
jgi:hypothetical protein